MSTTDLRQKLSRWHDDVDIAFGGWSDAWLDPDFRQWDITDVLAYIRVPILVVQGADDQYGTVAQVEAVERECYCPVEVALDAGRPACAASRSARRTAQGWRPTSPTGCCAITTKGRWMRRDG